MTKKTIALIAHDHKKEQLVAWCLKHQRLLGQHRLIGTGNTAKLIREKTLLNIEAFLSGPLGGDQQIGAKIATGEVDWLIFFYDPLAAQPHDPDVKALLRIAQLYDLPVATNPATANLIVAGHFLNGAK